jgi:kynureninase
MPSTHWQEPTSIYLCGNSLGCMPKNTRTLIQDELSKWGSHGVEGHFEGARPWAKIEQLVIDQMAEVVGAASRDEVAVMGSLTSNLHLLMVSFYRPTKQRHKILIEGAAFCSDQHAVRSQLALHGLTEEGSLISLKPREGESFLRTEDIIAVIEKEGESIATVMLGGVQYYTGQCFDMAAITEAGHKKGCMVGFDCAHAAGNYPLRLHAWGVDFACWCTYKYLNAGPGAIAGLFVHERHNYKTLQQLPRLTGWWGQDPDHKFKMSHQWSMAKGAHSWQQSNPAVLPTICLLASLQLVERAGGMPALRAKSLKLTAYLELLLDESAKRRAGKETGTCTILTPRDPSARGCQLSLLVDVPVREVHTLVHPPPRLTRVHKHTPMHART